MIGQQSDFRQYAEEAFVVFTVELITGVYCKSLTADLEAIDNRREEIIGELIRISDRFPLASDDRTRLASRLLETISGDE